MDYYQDFVETLYETRKPYDGEGFVIETLKNIKRVIHVLTFYKTTAVFHTDEEINRYFDITTSFLSILRLEIEKLYLMDIIHCCHYRSLSEKELSDLSTVIEEFFAIRNSLSKELKENSTLFRMLFQHIDTQINSEKYQYVDINSLYEVVLNSFDSFELYLLLCVKKLYNRRFSHLDGTEKGYDTNFSSDSKYPHTFYNSDCCCSDGRGAYYTDISPESELSHAFYHSYLKNTYEKSFQSLLFSVIDEKKVSDSQVYNKARVSKQVFSNIRKDADYIPKKVTVISLCIALELDISKTIQLLSSCGYTLSEYIMYDKIITYCITKSCYDIDEINIILTDFHLTPIGC